MVPKGRGCAICQCSRVVCGAVWPCLLSCGACVGRVLMACRLRVLWLFGVTRFIYKPMSVHVLSSHIDERPAHPHAHGASRSPRARSPALLARTHACGSSSCWQVKEGHDSTVRPKMLVFEFDGGRKYIDEWAADGKPSLTRAQMRRVQSWKILCAVLVPPILLLVDYGQGETFATPFQRRFWHWWHTFCALDSVDVAKAYAGGWRPPPVDTVKPFAGGWRPAPAGWRPPPSG